MGVAHRLGQAGGAGAEDQHRLVGESRPRGPVGHGSPAMGSDRGVIEIRDVSRRERFGQQGRAVGVGHGVDRGGQADGMVDFGRLPGRAEEHGGRPQSCDAVDGDHELHPVGHHEGDPMAGRHTPAGQMAGEGVAQTLQIAEGPALRRPLRMATRSPKPSAARSRHSCMRNGAIGNILL